MKNAVCKFVKKKKIKNNMVKVKKKLVYQSQLAPSLFLDCFTFLVPIANVKVNFKKILFFEKPTNSKFGIYNNYSDVTYCPIKSIIA